MGLDVILLPGGVLPAHLAYEGLVEALGGEVRAVAKDLELYVGPTPPPAYSLDHEIDGVLRTAAEHGFERFHLAGYSAGGAASAVFAARHPERLLSLALLEPAWLGREGLSSQERAAREQVERATALPPEDVMAAFVAAQLAPGVAPPPPPPDPPPPWMASRPAGLRAITEAFRSSTFELSLLRAFDHPVYFALGGLSNYDFYGRAAERAAAVFRDFTLEVFDERHHFDPPHRAEPRRLARSLCAHWAKTERRPPV